jgi:hypothetical protein
MVAGLDGHLVRSSFLEAEVRPIAGSEPLEVARRRLASARGACRDLGPAAAIRAVLDAAALPLVRLLGFDDPFDLQNVDAAAVTTLGGGARPIALIVVPWGTPYDALWRVAVTHAADEAPPGVSCSTVLRLRIVDAVRLYARRYVEVDVDLAADHPDTFAAFWRTCHVSAVAADAAEPQSLRALVAASDRHAADVCRSLRDGVLVASTEILRAMAARRRRTDRLACARCRLRTSTDDRLPHPVSALRRGACARAVVAPVYRESYSVEAMREEAERSARTAGLWDALRAMARLAHDGCRAGDLRVTAFNGRLFAPLERRSPIAAISTMARRDRR